MTDSTEFPSVIRYAECKPSGAYLPDEDVFVLPTGLTGEQERALMMDLLRTAATEENTTTTAMPPCPSWCIDKAGHQPEGQDLPSGHMFRVHTASLPGGGAAMEFNIDILADELTTLTGELVRLEEPRISVFATDVIELSAARARMMALALTEAAIRLDQITGGQQ